MLLAACATFIASCYGNHPGGPEDGARGSDAGPAPDAALSLDASTRVDAGLSFDASVRRDSGPALDASAELDAGSTRDASAEFDAGPPDAAMGLDAGASLDASAGLDGGRFPCDLPYDAGIATDAGFASSVETVDRSEGYGSAHFYSREAGFGSFGSSMTVYVLSDGSSWESGGGTMTFGYMRLERVERVGPLVRYHMLTDVLLIEATYYDTGRHSARYRVDTCDARVVIEATVGSSVAYLSGRGRVAMNAPGVYRDTRFHYLSAPVGAIVPYSGIYRLYGRTFDEATFDAGFVFDPEVVIDFAAYTIP